MYLQGRFIQGLSALDSCRDASFAACAAPMWSMQCFTRPLAAGAATSAEYVRICASEIDVLIEDYRMLRPELWKENAKFAC